MEDLKSVTVEYLRELARKHLGKGHSKLRTKAQLLAALAVVVPAVAVLARLAGIKLPGKKGAAGKGASPEQEQASKAKPATEPAKAKGRKAAVSDKKKKAPEASETPARVASEEAVQAAPTVKPAQVVNFPPRSRPSARPEPPPAPAAPVVKPSPPEAPASEPEQHAAEPLVEGFFVARVRGEDEARRHHLTEAHGPRMPEAGAGFFDEHLGELPLDYGDDAAIALPRDPNSLYVTWDFNAATRQRVLDGLEGARAVLRVFDGETLVREVDFALESRSFYLHGLPAGRPYRVEAHFLARDGRSRRIGSSNRAALPPVGPSTDTSVRFMRVPVRMPTSAAQAPGGAPAAAAPSRTVTVEEREYITWRRVPLPGSGGFEDLPDVHRERTTSEAEAPPGPGVPPHLELPSRPPGSSEQHYLDVERAPGASEQRYLGASRAQGSSEQTTWTPPPSGRGRQ